MACNSVRKQLYSCAALSVTILAVKQWKQLCRCIPVTLWLFLKGSLLASQVAMSTLTFDCVTV